MTRRKFFLLFAMLILLLTGTGLLLVLLVLREDSPVVIQVTGTQGDEVGVTVLMDGEERAYTEKIPFVIPLKGRSISFKLERGNGQGKMTASILKVGNLLGNATTENVQGTINGTFQDQGLFGGMGLSLSTN